MRHLTSLVRRPTLLFLALMYGAFGVPAAPAADTNPRLVVDSPKLVATTNRSNDAALLNHVVAVRSLSKKRAELLTAFPATPAGHNVAEIALLVPFGLRPTDHDENLLMARHLSVAAASASDSLGAIQSGLSNLSETYAAERQFLIQVAARLPAPRAAIVGFLSTEIRRPAALEASGRAGPAFFNGAIALDALIELTKDPAQIEAILVPALKAKSNSSEREALLARYHAAFPEFAEALYPQFGVSFRAQ